MSDMNKHTPGPWQYDPTEYKVWHDDNGEHQLGEIICAANGDRQANMAIAYVWDDTARFNARGIHNARLIAAAPDLLEAARAVVRTAEKHRVDVRRMVITPGAFSALVAAIAKAEGVER